MDKKQYMANYNHLYKKRRRETTTEMFSDNRYSYLDLKINPTGVNFTGTDIDEPIVCSHFGCPIHLSIEEKRFGNRCIHHQKQKPIDVAKYVSHPIKKTA